MRLRGTLSALIAALLLGAAAYLAWNTRPTDDRARAEVTLKLQTLSELDARWDIAAFAARTDPQPPIQAMTTLAPSIRSALADLQRIAGSLDSPALRSNLSGLAAAIDAKLELGGELASRTRTLHDTLNRAAASASAGSGTSDPRARERVAAADRAIALAAAELMAYWGSPDDGRRRVLEAALLPLTSAPAAGSEAPAAAAALREAAQAVLDGKPAFEQSLSRFTLSPAGPRLSALVTAYSAEVQGSIERQQLFRTYLLFYSAALLVLLGWIVSRLLASYRVIGRINRALQTANETLEEKVDLRTRELTTAMANLKESEAQLIQSEKMSSLGQMVAGVAHEINTPVAYVKNSLGSVDTRLDGMAHLARECETLLKLLDAGDTTDTTLDLQLARLSDAARTLGGSAAVDELATLVKDGLYGVDQISSIVSNLRDFSRLDRGQLQRFDLHQGIDSTLLLARHLLKAVRVDKRFGTDGTLNGTPSQINQVLLNLISNAAQAMGPAGGVITLTTSGDAQRLRLEIADTGPGIPADVLPRIFDPFFTTKPVGEGTGLGLAISYKIIAQHGGRIEVRSPPGAGATFSIDLPRTGMPAEPRREPAPPGAPGPGAGRR
jgi:two-component system, NtrC family, sensor kinase